MGEPWEEQAAYDGIQESKLGDDRVAAIDDFDSHGDHDTEGGAAVAAAEEQEQQVELVHVRPEEEGQEVGEVCMD